MAKNIYNASVLFDDFMECAVKYAHRFSEPLADEETYVRKFHLETAEKKINAINTILWDEYIIHKKPGNKGFHDSDVKLVEEMHQEILEGKKTKTVLLREYAEKAPQRDIYRDPNDPDSEINAIDSVVTRLDRLHQRLNRADKLNPKNQSNPETVDYGELNHEGFENFFKEEIDAISPWLNRYEEEILNYFEEKNKIKEKKNT